MTTYKTLLGSSSPIDGTLVVQNEDGSYMHQTFLYTGDPEVTQHLQAKDLDSSASMSVAYNCDAEIKALHYSEEHRHSNVWISGGCGTVCVYPTHPRYDSFPMIEQEISPCGMRGKVIAEWNLRDVLRVGIDF
jgi:hypothetical protein